MNTILADVVVAGGDGGVAHLLVVIIIIAAVIAIAYAALQYFGVAIPSIVVKIFGIVVVAALSIIAIKFLLSL